MHKQETQTIDVSVSGAPGFPLFRCRFLERGYQAFAGAASFDYPMPAFSRAYLLRRGSATIQTGPREVHVQPGRLYLLPANLTFRVEFQRDSELYYFHMCLEGADGTEAVDTGDVAEAPPQTDALGLQIMAGCDGHDATGDARWQTALFSALCELCATARVEPWARSARFRPLVEFIRCSPPHQLRIAVLAKEAGTTSSALARRFRKDMGIPLKVFLVRTTLARARELLAATDRSVKQIAADLGFADPSYFNRIFTKHVRVSPREYRKSCVNPGEMLVP